MHQPFFLFLLFFLISAIAVLHTLGIALSWYWEFPWFDILIHSLGGFWVAGMALWFSSYPAIKIKIPEIPYWGIALGFALLVGSLWEVFELLIGATFIAQEHYLSDTLTDLIADVLGAFVALFYFTHESK